MYTIEKLISSVQKWYCILIFYCSIMYIMHCSTCARRPPAVVLVSISDDLNPARRKLRRLANQASFTVNVQNIPDTYRNTNKTIAKYTLSRPHLTVKLNVKISFKWAISAENKVLSSFVSSLSLLFPAHS